MHVSYEDVGGKELYCHKSHDFGIDKSKLKFSFLRKVPVAMYSSGSFCNIFLNAF